MNSEEPEENLMHKNIDEKLDMLNQINHFTDKDLKIIELLAKDKASEIRQKISQILVFSKSLLAEELLLTLTKDKDSLVRVNACDSLCNSRSIRVMKSLMERVQRDRNILVKGYATLSIVDVALNINYDFYELSSFFENAVRKSKSSWLKVHYYYALYIFGEESYFTLLLAELNNKQYRTRCAAASILGMVAEAENKSKSMICNELYKRLKVEKTVAVRSRIENVIKDLNYSFL